MSTAQLAYLDELVVRDQAAAEALGEFDELIAKVAELRARAESALHEFRVGPVEIEECEAELARASSELETARLRLQRAEAEEHGTRGVDDPERHRAAEHQLVIERDSVSGAESRLADAETRLHARRVQMSAAGAEAPVVERAAGALAESLVNRPRLPANISVSRTGLSGVCEWAVEARAAFFIARSAVANEREQAIRHAGELGALVTGATVPASSMTVLAELIRDAARV